MIMYYALNAPKLPKGGVKLVFSAAEQTYKNLRWKKQGLRGIRSPYITTRTDTTMKNKTEDPHKHCHASSHCGCLYNTSANSRCSDSAGYLFDSPDTPKTDHFFMRTDIDWNDEVMFCREMERALNEARKEVEELRSEVEGKSYTMNWPLPWDNGKVNHD